MHTLKGTQVETPICKLILGMAGGQSVRSRGLEEHQESIQTNPLVPIPLWSRGRPGELLLAALKHKSE